jgi:hypothetical protein
MTPFDTWVLETAAAMVRPTEEEYDESLQVCAGQRLHSVDSPDWDALRLRFAICLVQARALECRHIAGELLLKQPSTLKMVADGLWDRSHRYEQLGLRMADRKWPKEEESEGPRLVQ